MNWYKCAQNSLIGSDLSSRNSSWLNYIAIREKKNSLKPEDPNLDKKWAETIKSIPGYDSRKSSSSWAYFDPNPALRKDSSKKSNLYLKGIDWKMYFTIDAKDGSEESMNKILEAFKSLPQTMAANFDKYNFSLLYKIPNQWSKFLNENDTIVIYHPFEPQSPWTSYISNLIRAWIGHHGLQEGKRSYHEGFDWFENTEATDRSKNEKVLINHDKTKEKLNWLKPDTSLGKDNGGSYGQSLAQLMSIISKDPQNPKWQGLIVNGQISIKAVSDWLMNHAKEAAEEIRKS